MAEIRECLPSCKESASRNPQAESRETDRNPELANRFAFCPPMPRVNTLKALGFFPASALLLHEALRPPGAEDARCVQPTSATQTICVHPHLVRSRLPLATFAAWTPRRVLGSTRYDRGTEWFTPSGPLWRIVPHTTRMLLASVFASCSWPHGFLHERGRFLPTVREDQSSL
jgi:hypothetical protein